MPPLPISFSLSPFLPPIHIFFFLSRYPATHSVISLLLVLHISLTNEAHDTLWVCCQDVPLMRPCTQDTDNSQKGPQTPHLPVTDDFSHQMTFPSGSQFSIYSIPPFLNGDAVFPLTLGLSTQHPFIWNTVCPSSSGHFLFGLYVSFNSSLVP